VSRVFLDTNIFVYTLDRRVAAKQAMAQELLEQAIAERTLVTSYQVVQEFLNVATTKFKAAMTKREARRYTETVLWPWCEVMPSSSLYAAAISVQEATGWAFFDSVILASAIESGCEVLYSEDLQAGRVLRGLEIRNPFA
jgi:predicted nucleic acid-binding protein